ncbi:unnamed protein product [Peniophora sp. CBMAI 1063]|nr:unnamed protein product [Peniophora sp. CBMAI 1063]
MAMAYHANAELSIARVAMRLAVFWALCSGVKAFVMTADDILDADIDAKVTRTKNRAIPRGDIALSRAWLFLALQGALGLCLAYTVLDPYTVRIAATTWPLFLVYPTCKR